MGGTNDFLAELASSSPTPGGGSVAALCGALGASLGSMVCNLTIGKKKYADVENDMKALLGQTERLRVELSELIDEDAAAFDKVMAAMKLPKETDEEKAVRSAAVQDALVDAAMVPLAVMQKCVEVVELSESVAAKGNSNAISDAGVAALVGRAGAHAARLNVLINLGGIRAERHAGFVEKANAALNQLTERVDRMADDVMEVVLKAVT
jgi:formiminotetrahydrofolate cyclodeaminase